MQAYLFRAAVLSALGMTGEAIISYCMSVHLNRNAPIITNNNGNELAKVWCQINVFFCDLHSLIKSFLLFSRYHFGRHHNS